MTSTDLRPGDRLIGRVPVRNLWLLMLYASEFARFRGHFSAVTDEDISDLPDLVARLLADSVEQRLRRNLTRGYRERQLVLTRVRGRIDVLTTEARQLLAKGQVFCRFEDFTNNTPRNRLVRAALNLMVRLVRSDQLRHRCRVLVSSLDRAGVSNVRPPRSELALDQIGRNDSGDRFMVALANLAFDLALPTEDSGSITLASPDRETVWVRHLFEKAILGFARIELKPLGWSVRGGIPLNWQVTSATDGLADILPGMITDILLDPPEGRRVVIDTKFASILAIGRFGGSALKSGYLYQMYTYLRSQEGCHPQWDGAAGLFLHPAVGCALHEHVVIQNHPITFATVDLSAGAGAIRDELRTILLGQQWKRMSAESNPAPEHLKAK